MIDIENLKAHATDSSQYAYYHLFKNVTSIKDYLDDPITILCQEEDIHFQIKNYISENFYYYQELSQSGRFLKDNQLYQDFDSIIKDNYQAINTFTTNKDDVVFLSHDVMFNRDDEKRVIQQINDYLKNSQILISLENKHQLQLMVELFDRHEMKYTLVGIDEVIYPGINLYVGKLASGLELIEEKVVILTAHELFGEVNVSKTKYFRFKDAKTLRNFQELNVGDYVVHDSYGIGQYLGIKTLDVKGYHKDYLYVAYAGDDTLYIPVEQFKMIRKYASADGKVPMIHALGSSKWTKAKQKAKNKIDDIADRLIELYAKRQKMQGFAFSKDNEWQKQFEDEFPYKETDDQLRCIEEGKKDMEQPRPMDRLLCGDVGYGKTEVAIRLAFKAVMDQKQVAYLVPTTVLANQQYEEFKNRMSGYAINVELLNRFRTTKEQEDVIKKLKLGEVDIVVGTHRILSKDVEFKDLGLLIIDEEHRFGVKDKEKIKQLKNSVDVLTMTATPIPRTLHMSILGIRDMSVIYEPPQNRRPVQTYVLEYDDEVIKEAITRELERNGQVFYLYNKVEGIEKKANEVSKLVPEAKVGFAHGKMTGKELEQIMLDFIQKKINVLVCTTILESGIDIPNANTIIVENADRLGLAQLYQIRGRVGRSDRQAYAYITYKREKLLSEVADKRLKAIKEFTEFGSGFKIAMRDLEIRGAGSLLGEIQHGHMEQVGYDTYCRLLDEVVKEIQGIEVKEEQDIQIDIDVSSYIPDSFIDNNSQKIEIYQNIALCRTEEDIQNVIDEIIDRYGHMPSELENLIEIARIKNLCRVDNVIKISQRKEKVVFYFDKAKFNPEIVDKLIKKYNTNIRFSTGIEPYVTVTIGSKIIEEIKEFLTYIQNCTTSSM